MGDDDAVGRPGPAGPSEVDNEPEERARPILTRRDFLVDAGAGVAASAAVAGVAAAVQSGAKPPVVTTVTGVGGPGAVVVAPPPGVADGTAGTAGTQVQTGGSAQISGPIAEKQSALKINGHTYKVVVQARATLADVLRYQIGLTGTKIGYNRAECGACTVIVDGKNVCSCTQMAFASQGKEIMTVEGLASDSSRFEGLHPIQQGFILRDAPQCGFCMSGQMMSAYSLLQAQPKPDFEQIRMGLSGNTCRCGDYNHLWDAVAGAAEHSA